MTVTSTSPTTASATRPPGQRHELGRYPTPRGERVIYAQRVHGRVRVTDRPATPRPGRSYLIAGWVQSLAELDALLLDYLDQAARHGDCPVRVRW